MVRVRGLEPPHRAIHEPKSCASAVPPHPHIPKSIFTRDPWLRPRQVLVFPNSRTYNLYSDMAARENYDISTHGLTDRCSASELPRHIGSCEPRHIKEWVPPAYWDRAPPLNSILSFRTFCLYASLAVDYQRTKNYTWRKCVLCSPGLHRPEPFHNSSWLLTIPNGCTGRKVWTFPSNICIYSNSRPHTLSRLGTSKQDR